MARRVKIILPKTEVREIEIGEKKVKIDSYISIEKYETILEDIKSNVLYNNEINDKYALMNLRYIKDILDLCTNIDTQDIDAEDLNSSYLKSILIDYIDNFLTIEDYIKKEYDKWVMENCFGLLAKSIPSAKEMEESMDKLGQTIENLPQDKLEMIAKSIVWNNMPALGGVVAPAEHKVIAEA